MQQVLDALRPVLQDPAMKKLGQHGKYDLHVLRRHGVDVQGYHDDTMLESFVLNSTATRHDMDSLALRYLGYSTIKFEDVAGKGAKQIPFSQVGIDEASRYASEDADITLRLHRARNTARVLGRASTTPMGLGFFGLSQAGKSYLISALAAGDNGKLETRFDDELIDFLVHVNPPVGGKEATGLRSRDRQDPGEFILQ
ncbi:hypothetical protein G6F61_013890 [Rhizopus arrhizus]|nr:hypothetical protein G6F61_013890 [Rhizopus arrhizus]